MDLGTLRLTTTGLWEDLETLRLSPKGHQAPNKPTAEATVSEDKGKENGSELETMRLSKHFLPLSLLRLLKSSL